MPSLAETIARAAALRQGPRNVPGGSNRLLALTSFGDNPGALDAHAYVSSALAPGAALIVVLHGCTQNAAAYDYGAGWSRLADELGFAVLFPEQRRTNNPNLCFNWFQPGDTARDQGEAGSIRQMVAAMVDQHAIDPARIFVTGLSAGGAMATVMLAAYPEVFAGGAVVAGLPYGVAASVPEALERMRGQGLPAEATLVDELRGASPHRGAWPTLSVWHGTADATVSPANADALLAQWRGLHQIATEPAKTEMIDGHAHRLWRDADGRAVIEDYRISGMGHGTPLSTHGADSCGAVGPHMLEAGISSTRHIARFFGLELKAGATDSRSVDEPNPSDRATPATRSNPRAPGADWHRTVTADETRKPVAGVGKIIEDALKAAGLMK